jgi:ABC-type transport system involved in cytochrome c biogenesis permease component
MAQEPVPALVQAARKQGTTSIDWAYVYMSLVAAGHVGAIAAGFAGGGLVMFLVLYVLALPLFIPGFLVGVYCLANAAKGNRARLFLALAVVALPIYEWHLLGTLKSGWAGG